MAKKVNAKKISDENEIKKFIQFILIVTVIFGLFYLLTILINKKDEKTNNEKENTSEVIIQYDEILIGNMFNQKNDNYYVLIEDIEDVNVSVFHAYLSLYSQVKDAKRVYTAVINNMFNNKYLGEESNLSNDITKFKVSKTTLLEISNGKIVKSYEKDEDITKILKEISQFESKEEK